MGKEIRLSGLMRRDCWRVEFFACHRIDVESSLHKYSRSLRPFSVSLASQYLDDLIKCGYRSISTIEINISE